MKAAKALARSPDAEPHLYLHPKVSMNVFISLSEDVNAASLQKHLGQQAMLKPVVSLS
jgi:hypothetical protein